MSLPARLDRWASASAVATVRSFFPPDPGLVRMRDAALATLAAALTLLLLALLDRVLSIPITARILGFAVSLFLAAMVHDATRWRELGTMLLGFFPALSATVLAIGLRSAPLAGDIALVALMAGAIYAQAHAPRWPPLGTVAVIPYVITLVTHPPMSEVPMRSAVIAVAIAACVLVRLVFWPERPAATVARITRSIHQQIAALLGMIEDGVTRGAWARGERHRLRRGLVHLGEASALATAKLDPEGKSRGEALHFTELELAADRTVWVALHHMPSPPDRPAVIAGQQAVRRAFVGGPLPAERAPSGGRLGAALATLGYLLSAPRRDTPVPETPPPAVPSTMVTGLRSAGQAALATAIAVFGGHLISPTRWYWAAFAAYVVFQGARSSGQSLMKGLRFVAGTAGGVIGGGIVATVLAGHTALLLTGTIVAVFLAFNASTASYGAMVFWITIILALMFSLIGYFTPELLALRLEEGVFGVVCGIVVAALLWGVRTGDIVAKAQQDYVRALVVVARSATDSLITRTADPALAGYILALQDRFHALWDAMGSVVSLPSRRPSLRRRANFLSACDYWGRELGWFGRRADTSIDPAVANVMQRAIARIERAADRLCAVSDRVEADRGLTTSWVEEAAQAQATLASTNSSGVRPVPAYLLLRIEAALYHLLAEGSGVRYATTATAVLAPA